jgi:CoA:oxalate CoA-transferase
MSSRGAFAGIKVLAVARVIAAPFAAYQLALQGADVLTIETPGEGDSYRYSGDRNASLAKQGMATPYLAQNANKRSMTLNLSHPEGQELFRRLAKDADVLIENLRTGAMDKYALGFQHLSQLNPRLVYCSVTGYGQTGPKRNDPAMDMAIQAASGMMSVTGTPESGPIKTSYPAVDYATGLAATAAIATALFQRSQSGKGQHVDVSMLETALLLLSPFTVGSIMEATEFGLVGNGSNLGGYVHNAFKCKSGVLLIAAQTELRRDRLWKLLAMTGIYEDPRFKNETLRRANVRLLEHEIEVKLGEKSAQEWEEIMQKVGIPAMYVRSIPEIVKHPQVESRGFFHRFEFDPELNTSVTVPTTSFKLSDSTVSITRPPPRLGEHTNEVLHELGLNESDIEKLKSKNVV